MSKYYLFYIEMLVMNMQIEEFACQIPEFNLPTYRVRLKFPHQIAVGAYSLGAETSGNTRYVDEIVWFIDK